MARTVALDVHQGFCEVAFREGSRTRSAGRLKTSRPVLERFARSLGREDQVVLEASSPALEVARIFASHVGRVVVANTSDVRAISHARVKSDRFDARTLAELGAAGMLCPVWVPDRETQALRRRIARRSALVRQRTAAKNEVHAVLARCLLGRGEVADLFGVAGRAWLGAQELPDEELETVAGCLRQIDFFDQEIAQLDKKLAASAVASEDGRRLMTIPGVGVGTAVALIAAIGDISRFESPEKLVAYLGLDPKLHQSGEGTPKPGRISKRGDSHARAMLVEAAWSAIRSPGPLRAFGERIRARKGPQIAAVAIARKLAVLAWQLLTKGEDYAYAQPSRVRAKLRAAELKAGAPKRPTRRKGQPTTSPAQRAAERDLADQAEAAYRRLVADWQSTRPAKGAGATPGRANQEPPSGKATRQTQAPQPAL
jgi:transposase